LDNRNIILIFAKEIINQLKIHTMKKNLFVLLIIIMFSALTSALGGMPSTWSQFFMGFGVCFCFWFCMLAPAFASEN
jgi:hypothetical protein